MEEGFLIRREDGDEEEIVRKTKRLKGKRIYKYVENKIRRSITFSKRKKGILEKANQLNLLTGCKVAVLIISENGYRFAYKSHQEEQMFSLEYEKSIREAIEEEGERKQKPNNLLEEEKEK